MDEAQEVRMCLKHLHNSRGRIYVLPEMRKEGIGDCSTCRPDKSNAECKGYRPITIRVIRYQNKKVEN